MVLQNLLSNEQPSKGKLLQFNSLYSLNIAFWHVFTIQLDDKNTQFGFELQIDGSIISEH